MLVTGILSSRFGSRPIILVGGVGLAAMLPVLAVASTPVSLAVSLLFFGASLGSLDVAMNIHAVEVERHAGYPVMSGFHALFSIGGFGGAALMTLLLSAGTAPNHGALIGSALMVVAIVLAWPRLLRTRALEGEPHFALPRGIVLVLAGLTAITFLAEGALLDWSALLVSGDGLVDVKQSGIGYMLFSIAMTVGRLTGDALTARIGDRASVLWGGLIAIGGFVVLLTAPVAAVALAGFILIGLGAANIVPILFRQAGNQTVMPAGLAVAAITTTGYAGVLVGPAAIGFVAKLVGLPASFWMLAGLFCFVPLWAALMPRRA
jgi:predicted MFS family arabinose efflux permease